MTSAEYVYTVVVVSALLVLFIARVRRIRKAIKLGFWYDGDLSYSQNKHFAIRLREYAENAARTFERHGVLPNCYFGTLFDLGLDVSRIHTSNPCEIADICCKICSALKC